MYFLGWLATTPIFNCTILELTFKKNIMKILAKVIVGSTSQGLNTATSDIDLMYLYKLPLEDYLYNPDTVITKDNNNTTQYEIGNAIQLLAKSNPTILSLLFIEDEFVLESSEEFEYLRSIRNTFLTKKAKSAFVGFIKSQVAKSRSADAKMNWSKEKICRKSILDFCYINTQKEEVVPLKSWLAQQNLTQQDICVAKINQSTECFNVYSMHAQGGLYDEWTESNQLKTPNIPIALQPIAKLIYKGDLYSSHCQEYKQYQEWEANYNRSRFVKGRDNTLYNGKNLMHAVRLLNMAQEFSKFGVFIVDRRNGLEGSKTVQELLDIRHGKAQPNQLLDWIDEELSNLSLSFDDNSSIPDKIDETFIKDLIIKLRK